jgi:hypothetical protein
VGQYLCWPHRDVTEVRHAVFEKHIDAVNGKLPDILIHTECNGPVGLRGKKYGKTKLMNMVMQVS